MGGRSRADRRYLGTFGLVLFMPRRISINFQTFWLDWSLNFCEYPLRPAVHKKLKHKSWKIFCRTFLKKFQASELFLEAAAVE